MIMRLLKRLFGNLKHEMAYQCLEQGYTQPRTLKTSLSFWLTIPRVFS